MEMAVLAVPLVALAPAEVDPQEQQELRGSPETVVTAVSAEHLTWYLAKTEQRGWLAFDVKAKVALSALLAGPLLLYAHSFIVDVRMMS